MASMGLSAAMAQQNNPYNKRGVDYFTSLGIIKADFNAGMVKEINQESINKYAKLLPLQHKASVELSAQIIKTIKAPGFSFEQFVQSANLSDFTKKTLPQLLNVKQLSADAWASEMTAKAEAVKTAKISAFEKEFLLTMVAVSYQGAQTGNTYGRPCYIVGNGYQGQVSEITCITAMAAIGFFVGFQICGLWCGLGGMLIGGISAALS